MGILLHDEIAAAGGVGLEPPVLPADPARVPGTDPGEAWRALKRRFRLLWTLLLAALPGTFLLAFSLGGVIPLNAATAAIGLVWMAAVAAAGARVAGFACPRCGLAFFENWIFLKMLRDRCVHCDLPRDASDLAPR